MAGVVGIAVALLLILALRAIFAGMKGRLTVYIDRSGADVIVAQQGVQTMHMTQSALPAAAVAIGRVPGVASSTGVLYKSAFVESVGNKSGIVALVGGGPIPSLSSGRPPGRGEIVLDRALTARLGVSPGGTVHVIDARCEQGRVNAWSRVGAFRA